MYCTNVHTDAEHVALEVRSPAERVGVGASNSLAQSLSAARHKPLASARQRARKQIAVFR